ncbi:MAG: hypothetical protein H0V82_03455 [Candidatus Protochlamydia sp.]|nr:hypothetical protein [Candidatus Protochlamydia sp.]
MKISIYFSCFIWITVFAYSMCQFSILVYQAAWYNLEANYFSSASVDSMKVDTNIWQKKANEKRSSDAKINPNRVLIYTQPYFDDLIVIG